MQRRLMLFAVGLSVASVLAVGVARAGGNGAGVVRENGTCQASDNTGSWFFQCNFQIVFEPNGKVTQYLAGPVIPEGSSPLPSQALTGFAGGPCLIFGGQVVTTVVAGVVTPGGQVKLTCKSYGRRPAPAGLLLSALETRRAAVAARAHSRRSRIV